MGHFRGRVEEVLMQVVSSSFKKLEYAQPVFSMEEKTTFEKLQVVSSSNW
jgi:hypothetical protein